MDVPLILALATSGLMISDKILTEYALKKELATEKNPLMKKKIARFISIPIGILSVAAVYFVSKQEINEFLSNIGFGGLIFLLGLYGTAVGSNLYNILKEKKSLQSDLIKIVLE